MSMNIRTGPLLNPTLFGFSKSVKKETLKKRKKGRKEVSIFSSFS